MTDRELFQFQKALSEGEFTKLLSKQLNQRYAAGYWQVSINELKEKLKLPSDIKVIDIKKMVIIPAIDAIKQKATFIDIDFEVIMKDRKACGFIFRWTPSGTAERLMQSVIDDN